MLDGRREIAAAVGVAPAAGEGRFAHHHPAPGDQAARARQQPADEAQDVFRPQRVGPRRDAVIEEIHAQAHAGKEHLVDLIGDGLFLHFPAGQVDV